MTHWRDAIAHSRVGVNGVRIIVVVVYLYFKCPACTLHTIVLLSQRLFVFRRKIQCFSVRNFVLSAKVLYTRRSPVLTLTPFPNYYYWLRIIWNSWDARWKWKINCAHVWSFNGSTIPIRLKRTITEEKNRQWRSAGLSFIRKKIALTTSIINCA